MYKSLTGRNTCQAFIFFIFTYSRFICISDLTFSPLWVFISPTIERARLFFIRKDDLYYGRSRIFILWRSLQKTI